MEELLPSCVVVCLRLHSFARFRGRLAVCGDERSGGYGLRSWHTRE